jgi:hypothetical protein
MTASCPRLTASQLLLTDSESESESELLYKWQSAASQFIFEPSPLRLTYINFFYLTTCCHSPYVTSSLTRGRVCRLQLLLVSPAQSFSGPSLAGLMAIFCCFRFEISPTWRARPPYLYHPGTGRLSYTPDTGFHCRRP